MASVTTRVSPSRGRSETHNTNPLQAANWQSAPSKVVQPYCNGQPEKGWSAWCKYLTSRDKPKPISRLWPGKNSPLLWAAPEQVDQDGIDLIKLLRKVSRRKDKASQEAIESLSPWLAESEGSPANVALAMQSLAWCHAIAPLSAYAQGPLWWDLLEYLANIARDTPGLDAQHDPLLTNLIAGELPLTLSYLFPEITTCSQLATPARELLSQSLVDLTDGEGMLQARHLPIFRPLLACLTRCRTIGNHLKGGCWKAEAEDQYRWMSTQAVRLTRPDGQQILTPGAKGAWCADLLSTAIDLGGDASDEEIADHALPGRSGGYEPETKWPKPAYSSEWGELAILRTDWSRKSSQLAVTYDDGQIHLELGRMRDVLLAGQWDTEIALAGRTIRTGTSEEWEEVCWESDNEVDFLELELHLDEALTLQRSFLLARDDEILLIADALIGEAADEINYTSKLPLAMDIQAFPERETREVTLQSNRPLARVLPLALSEWQCDPRGGSLANEDGQLVLRQDGQNSLYAPLLIDLSTSRLGRPLTWRQLSVAETRQNVTPDVAVGFRAEIGKAQWLIYRSLAPAANRTVLGQNLSCELHVSRFLRDGTVEELLEIE